VTQWDLEVLAAELRRRSDDLSLYAGFLLSTLSSAPDDERRLRRVLALLDRVGDRVAALRLYERFEQRRRKE